MGTIQKIPAMFMRGRMGRINLKLRRSIVHLIRNVAIFYCALTCHLHAQTVVVNSNLVTPSPTSGSGNFSFRVFQDAAATDHTGVWFNYQPFNIAQPASISLANINIDEGSDWYVVHEGDVFSPSTIQAGLFTPIVTSGPTSYPAVDLGRAGDVWLGIATGRGFQTPVQRTVFGWVHLQQFATLTPFMIENVMSYDSPGIIVGTTTLVPEPAMISTAICALLWCFAGRRSRRN
jgi:hypothetical protein